MKLIKRMLVRNNDTTSVVAKCLKLSMTGTYDVTEIRDIVEL